MVSKNYCSNVRKFWKTAFQKGRPLVSRLTGDRMVNKKSMNTISKWTMTSLAPRFDAIRVTLDDICKSTILLLRLISLQLMWWILRSIFWISFSKGQLISKGLFGFFNSPKRWTENLCSSRLGQKFTFSNFLLRLTDL